MYTRSFIFNTMKSFDLSGKLLSRESIEFAIQCNEYELCKTLNMSRKERRTTKNNPQRRNWLSTRECGALECFGEKLTKKRWFYQLFQTGQKASVFQQSDDCRPVWWNFKDSRLSHLAESHKSLNKINRKKHNKVGGTPYRPKYSIRSTFVSDKFAHKFIKEHSNQSISINTTEHKVQSVSANQQCRWRWHCKLLMIAGGGWWRRWRKWVI